MQHKSCLHHLRCLCALCKGRQRTALCLWYISTWQCISCRCESMTSIYLMHSGIIKKFDHGELVMLTCHAWACLTWSSLARLSDVHICSPVHCTCESMTSVYLMVYSVPMSSRDLSVLCCQWLFSPVHCRCERVMSVYLMVHSVPASSRDLSVLCCQWLFSPVHCRCESMMSVYLMVNSVPTSSRDLSVLCCQWLFSPVQVWECDECIPDGT